MTSELVIDVQPKEISIALLEDKALVEFQKESQTASFNVGNMYLGKVKKMMPGLNACFVDVGFGKDAFLHYLDLGPQFNSYQKYLKQVVSDRKKLYPMSEQDFQFAIELGHSFTFGHGAYNHAEVFRLDALQELLQAGAFFARLNF